MAYHDRSQFHYVADMDEAKNTDFVGVVRVGDDWFERWNGDAMYKAIMDNILIGAWL